MIVRSVDPAVDATMAGQLWAVQRAAYAVEAELIGDDRIPTLHEHVDDLRRAPLNWLAALDGTDVLGAVAWLVADQAVDIDRLVVAPHAHRRGVGSRLIREVIEHAQGRPIAVSTGSANLPARTFYERLGFERVADREALPGLWVTAYCRAATVV